MQTPTGRLPWCSSGDQGVKWPIRVHWADRMRVVLHPTDQDATILLGPSEGGLGGQDALGGFPASGRNAYLSGANAFFADDIKWHTLQNSGISGVVEGEKSNQLESVINVSIQLTGEVI